MAGRPSNRSSQTQAMPPAPPRQNEYFVPRDGIDREVITSDICRYLGNDALVRPGTYESPDGVVTQGYYITAYRNLTSAMIQDLKADSARWEQERRAAARSSGGSGGSREHPRGHSDYSTWRNRQREQEYEAASYSTSSTMDAEYHPAPAPPANPVYGGQPYPAAPPASYPPATYPPPAHASSTQYPAQAPYGYPSNPPPPTQYSPQPQASGDRYSAMAPPPPMPGTYRQDAFVHGSNYQTSAPYATANPARMPPAVPLASAAPSRTYNAPVAPAGTPIYGTETDPYGYPPAGNPAAGFPTDALYGRGSPAGATARPGFAAPPDPKYDDLQSPPLQPATTSANPAPAQMTSSGAPAPRHDRDREREPEPNERDYRDHRVPRGPGRDERHPDGNGPRQRHR